MGGGDAHPHQCYRGIDTLADRALIVTSSDADALMEIVGNGSATDVVQLLRAVGQPAPREGDRASDGDGDAAGNAPSTACASASSILRNRQNVVVGDSGEASSPTSPSTPPPTQPSSAAEAVAGLTPEQKAACREFADKYSTMPEWVDLDKVGRGGG